jgi:hypothetical protein
MVRFLVTMSQAAAAVSGSISTGQLIPASEDGRALNYDKNAN